jgi:type II secretory pathway pseudopilin PulG
MKKELKSSERGARAFTRTELLVVVLTLAVVLAGLVLALRWNKEPRRRAQCAANLRQLGAALSLYAGDSGGLLPDCTRANPGFFGSKWLWDLNINVVSEMERRGASRRVFYCPSNDGMNDDKRWNFFRYDRTPIRVVGYGFLMNGCMDVPAALWRTNLLGDGVRPPSETELAFDATLSQRGSYDHIQGKWVDRSNHVGSRGRPLGGNILFEDGHAQWRDFGQMRHRIFGDAVWDY